MIKISKITDVFSGAKIYGRLELPKEQWDGRCERMWPTEKFLKSHLGLKILNENEKDAEFHVVDLKESDWKVSEYVPSSTNCTLTYTNRQTGKAIVLVNNPDTNSKRPKYYIIDLRKRPVVSIPADGDSTQPTNQGWEGLDPRMFKAGNPRPGDSASATGM